MRRTCICVLSSVISRPLTIIRPLQRHSRQPSAGGGASNGLSVASLGDLGGLALNLCLGTGQHDCSVKQKVFSAYSSFLLPIFRNLSSLKSNK